MVLHRATWGHMGLAIWAIRQYDAKWAPMGYTGALCFQLCLPLLRRAGLSQLLSTPLNMIRHPRG